MNNYILSSWFACKLFNFPKKKLLNQLPSIKAQIIQVGTMKSRTLHESAHSFFNIFLLPPMIIDSAYVKNQA